MEIGLRTCRVRSLQSSIRKLSLKVQSAIQTPRIAAVDRLFRLITDEFKWRDAIGIAHKIRGA